MYVILGACIGYISGLLLLIIRVKIEEGREDRNGKL